MRRSISIALVGLILALVAAGFWWWQRSNDTAGGLATSGGTVAAVNSQPINSGLALTNTQATSTNGVSNVTNSGAVQSPALDPEMSERLRAQQLATSFTERYGSYSTDSNFANIEDLFIFMTDRLRAEQEQFIASKRAAGSSRVIYSGVVAKALVTRELTYDKAAGIATYEIATQRRMSDAQGKTSTAHQTLRLRMQYAASQWQVDAADWQ